MDISHQGLRGDAPACREFAHWTPHYGRLRPSPVTSGLYAGNESLVSRCAVLKQWLMAGEDQLQAFTRLKTRYPAFFAQRSVADGQPIPLFESPHFENFFGVPAANAATNLLEHVTAQARDCAFLIPDESLDEVVGRQLFDGSEGRKKSYGNVEFSRSNPKFKVPDVVEAASKQNRIADELRSAFNSWSGADNYRVETFMQQNGEKVRLLSDSRLLALADEFEPIVEVHKLQARKKVAATRVEAIQRKLKLVGSDIDILKQTPLAVLLGKIERGEQVVLSADEMLSMAGFSYVQIRKCQIPRLHAEREELQRFAQSGMSLATTGPQLIPDNLAFGDNFSGLMRSSLPFALSARAAEAAGCSDATEALAGVVLEIVRATQSDVDGEAPIFERTCALKFDLTRCRCLARVAQSAFPDVHSRTYERSFIPQMMRVNPMLGLQIARDCHIQNY